MTLSPEISSEISARPHYNLVDSPWIPCTAKNGGSPRLLGLREVFQQANQLAGIADASPVVTISLYRLLLAILHRSLDGPANIDAWQRIWDQGQWDLDTINHYLDDRRAGFDLFDENHPFYQTPGIPKDYAKPATQLTHERASERNRSLLFDHSLPKDTLSIAEAARYLLMQQNFAVGGLISLIRGEPIANKYASGSPLLGGAVVLVRGETLFETLMLNAVRYSRRDERPFPFSGVDDQPAWERTTPPQPIARRPTGYVDLLTWQSRRIRLFPQVLPDGEVRVSAVALMKGYQFIESFEHWGAETMLAFRANKTNRSGPAYFPLGLKTERVVWRDSQALLQSITGERSRPQTMSWLGTLMGEGSLKKKKMLPLEIYGLIPDQANILDWRRESLPLPLRLLEQNDQATRQLLERLADGLQLAETISRFFDATLIVWSAGTADKQKEEKQKSAMWVLCEALLAGLSEREPKREECGKLAQRFVATTIYWSRLEVPFHTFVEKLAKYDDDRDITVEKGATFYGMGALSWWAQEIERIARDIFAGVLNDLDTSARTLYASARAQQRFDYHRAILLKRYRASTDQVAQAKDTDISSTSEGATV